MKATLLCVDDEPSILDSLKAELREAFGGAYRYETAEDAAEALEIVDEVAARGSRLVAIVSDWLMPGMKGDELLALVHRRHPAAVTLMLTGHADAQAVERARREAALYACLHKPVDPGALVETVRSALATLEP